MTLGNFFKERTDAIRNSIHNEIVRQTGFINRGKKEENFHVLRESSAPAILTENGFIDNANDASNLKDKRSEEHTSELQSRGHLVCRLLLEKKKNKYYIAMSI